MAESQRRNQKTCTCEYISPGAAALHAAFHGVSGPLPKLTTGCPIHGIRCPECSSRDCRQDSYDFGADASGYHNSGVRGICRKCGHNADIEDFQPKNPAEHVMFPKTTETIDRAIAAAILGKLGGASKSAAKQRASKKNGRKGGRPKKTVDIR